MRNSEVKIDSANTPPLELRPMVDGAVNASFFKYIQSLYRLKTGYNLILSDPNGSIQMGLPDCDKFPCMKSCRESREGIITEAMRTGRVCMDTCHQGYVIWGLPVHYQGELIGGLVVVGGEHFESCEIDDFGEACAELYKLMADHNLLPPESHLVDMDLSRIHRFIHREGFDNLHGTINGHRKQLLNALQTSDLESANIHFSAIREAFEQASAVPLDVLRGVAGDLIFSTKRQFLANGTDAYSCVAEAGSFVGRIAVVEDVDGLLMVLDTFFSRITGFSRQRPKDQDELLVERATTYMEENLRDNLTRESVSLAVGISPSHFSRLIREKKGRTFTDLLNQYRIERASTLLVRSSHTLAYIADEAGFCDQSYFSKVFRRYKDMSPAQYRDSRKN